MAAPTFTRTDAPSAGVSLTPIDTSSLRLTQGAGGGSLAIGSAISGGSDKQLLFIDGGALGSAAGFSFDKATGTLATPGLLSLNGTAFLKSYSGGLITLLNAEQTGFGYLQFGGTTNAFPAIQRNGAALNFMLADGSSAADISAANATFSGVMSSVYLLGSTNASFVGLGDGNDTRLYRDAAGILAQRNGVSGQASRTYNKITDASNGEWGTFDWTTTANTLTIGTKANGLGAVRGLNIDIGATSVANITSALTTWNTAIALSTLRVTNINSNNNTVTAMMIANTTGDVTFARGLIAPSTGWVRTTGTTVSALPAASTAGQGARAFVTDASATTFMSVVAAGGANKVPVVSDGTNWLIG